MMWVRWVALIGLGSLSAVGCGTLAEDAAGSDGDAAGGGGETPNQPGGGGGNGSPTGLQDNDYEDAEYDNLVGLELAGCSSELPSTRILYAVADDSHSVGSAAYAAAALSAYSDGPFGLPPMPSALRATDMINYYGLDYAPADGPVLEAARAVDALGELLETEITVQVAFMAPPDAVRRPLDVVFVVDTSGSMSGESMARQKEVLGAAAASLGALPGTPDIVSVVSWNSDSRVLLEPTPVAAANDPVLLGVIEGLETSGGSDLALGLQTAYELLGDDASRSKRLVFITDGAAAIDSKADQVLQTIGSAAIDEGVRFVGIGVGAGDVYHPELLRDAVATTHGTFVYAGGQGAVEELVARFDGLMDDAAFDVQLELEVPGYLETDAIDQELAGSEAAPTHDLAIGGTMVFRRTLTACSPEVFKTAETVEGLIGGRIVFKSHPLGEYESRELTPIGIHTVLDQESAHMLRVRALLSYGDALRTPTPSRILGAQSLLESAALPSLAGLLDRHPALTAAP